MAEKGLSITITFPQGMLFAESLPVEKVLPHESRATEEFYADRNPVLCANNHYMIVVNIVPVEIDAKNPQVPDLVKIAGYYCEVCDRYKVVGVEEPLA